VLGERPSPSGKERNPMPREWGTTLVTRPPPVDKHVRASSKTSNGAEFDFPVSDDESKAATVRKGAIKNKPNRDTFDLPSSEEETTPKPTVSTAKRKRSTEPFVVSTKRQVATSQSNRKVLESPKSSKGVLDFKSTEKSKLQRGSGNVKPRQLANNVAPGSSRLVATSPRIPTTKRKRVVESDLFDFPESSGDEKESIASTASRSRKVRSQTPATVSKVTRKASVEPAKKGIQHDTSSKLQRSKRAASAEISRQTTTKPSTSSTTKATSSKGRARATKSPAESITSTRSRAKTPSTSVSTLKKGRSAPEPLSLMLSEESSRGHTPFSALASPPSISSPQFQSFRTPSPKPRMPQMGESQPGTVTPRQTALWSKLLEISDDASDVPMSKLRLTSSAPRSIPPVSATVSHSGTVKRRRLIDGLKGSATILEEDSDSDIVSDSEPEGGKIVLDTPLNSQVSATMSQLHPTAKVTYGQQRSYLQEKEDDALFDTLMDDIIAPAADKQSQGQFDLGLESDEEDASQPRNMHDLRAAGSKKRILAELEHLVDGIKGQGLGSASAQRFDILELTKKIMDSATLDVLLDHGLEQQLLVAFAESNDTIIHVLAAICLCLIIKQSSNITVLRTIHRSGFIDHLVELFGLTVDITRILKDRKFNMSKIAQSSMIEFFRNETVQANLLPSQDSKCLSPRLIGIIIIERLVRKIRELGSDETLLNEKIILQLISIFGPDSLSTEAVGETELVLSTLESSSIGALASGRSPWSTNALKKLVSHLSDHLTEIESDAPTPPAIRLLILRLSLNLTNNNSRACDIFAVPNIIIDLMKRINHGFSLISNSSEVSPVAMAMDELILSLGAMINLAELSDLARSKILSDDGKELRKVVGVFLKKQDKVQEVCFPSPFSYYRS
jgi:Wings apart-like protein regulation of heterochromatin